MIRKEISDRTKKRIDAIKKEYSKEEQRTHLGHVKECSQIRGHRELLHLSARSGMKARPAGLSPIT